MKLCIIEKPGIYVSTSTKQQCMTFCAKNPREFFVMPDSVKLDWSDKVKYLGHF